MPAESERTAQQLAPLWADVAASIAEARNRLWIREASRRAWFWLSWAGVLTGSLILLYRGHVIWVTEQMLTVSALVAAAVGALWLALARPALASAAATLDTVAGGRDRVQTALETRQTGEASPWRLHQLTQTGRWSRQLQLNLLIPVTPRPPPPALGLALIAVLIGSYLPTSWLTPPPQTTFAHAVAGALPPAPPPLREAAARMTKDDLELLRRDAALLEALVDQVEDVDTKRWLRSVRGVIEDVTAGRLDKRTALERMSALARARPGRVQPDQSGTKGRAKAANARSKEHTKQTDKAVTKALSEAMSEALKQAPKGPEREQLKRAAKRGDLGAMGRLLEKLAERAQRDMSDKELEKWIKTAEKYAKNINRPKLSKKFDRLRSRIERLQRKRNRQGGLNQSDVRRLKRTRRELAQLRREQGDLPRAKYQLQRLQRQARSAAQEMRRRQERQRRLRRPRDKQAQREQRRQREELKRAMSQQMKRAARELRRQSAEQRARRARRIADDRMKELRRALQRAGRQQNSRRKFEQQARARRAQRQAGQRRGGRGQMGRRQGRRSQGQGPQGQRSRQQAKGPSMKQMQTDSRMGQLRASSRSGSQPGDRPGADNEGGAGQAAAKAARTEKVTGVHGKGPSIKKVFTDAARHGFAKKGWRAVYADYSAVAEEMLDSESIPTGKQSVVRRYFELIRPR